MKVEFMTPWLLHFLMHRFLTGSVNTTQCKAIATTDSPDITTKTSTSTPETQTTNGSHPFIILSFICFPILYWISLISRIS